MPKTYPETYPPNTYPRDKHAELGPFEKHPYEELQWFLTNWTIWAMINIDELRIRKTQHPCYIMKNHDIPWHQGRLCHSSCGELYSRGTPLVTYLLLYSFVQECDTLSTKGPVHQRRNMDLPSMWSSALVLTRFPKQHHLILMVRWSKIQTFCWVIYMESYRNWSKASQNLRRALRYASWSSGSWGMEHQCLSRN